MRTLLTILFVCVTWNSCQRKPVSVSVQQFVRSDFGEQTTLTNPTEIVMDSLLYPASFYLIRDTLMLVQNQPSNSYLLEIYSTNDWERPLLQLAPKGSGPGELTSADVWIVRSGHPFFYVQDRMADCYYKVHIDSLLSRKSFWATERFPLNSSCLPVADICEMDEDTYCGYDMWYMEGEEYSNAVKTPLKLFSKSTTGNDAENIPSYFTASVNGARIFRLPDRHEIWTADLHKDEIIVYNDSLQPIRKLTGPDGLQPSYRLLPSDAPMGFVDFEEGKSCRGYLSYWLTPSHIYLLYAGDEMYDMTHLKPVDVFKLDYEGHLLSLYHLDRHLTNLSVDSEEHYLYGTARTSMQGESVLVRYDLP